MNDHDLVNREVHLLCASSGDQLKQVVVKSLLPFPPAFWPVKTRLWVTPLPLWSRTRPKLSLAAAPTLCHAGNSTLADIVEFLNTFLSCRWSSYVRTACQPCPEYQKMKGGASSQFGQVDVNILGLTVNVGSVGQVDVLRGLLQIIGPPSKGPQSTQDLNLINLESGSFEGNALFSCKSYVTLRFQAVNGVSNFDLRCELLDITRGWCDAPGGGRSGVNPGDSRIATFL